MFTRIWARRISEQSLGSHVVARMLHRAVAAGLDGTRITAHSLRAGHVATVLVNRYIRPLEALATTSSKYVGL